VLAHAHETADVPGDTPVRIPVFCEFAYVDSVLASDFSFVHGGFDLPL